MEEKVPFTEKKVDESWKEEVARQRGEPKAEPHRDSETRPGLSFAAFLSSLGYQTLMHLGEVPDPMTQERRPDLGAAKETIDLLMLLESKTRGNRTPDEEKLLKTLLPELQMKFASKVGSDTP